MFLVVNINSYIEILKQTKGVIAEFVNPNMKVRIAQFLKNLLG